MPNCKNNKKVTYKGTEKSPLGLGYCPNRKGMHMLGKDGYLYVVKINKSGKKQWMKEKINDFSKAKKYVKTTKQGNKTRREYIYGLQYIPDYIHEVVDYNTFKTKPIKIPKNFRRSKINKEYVSLYHFDKNKSVLKSNNNAYKKIKSKHKGMKSYYIHDNGSRPYIVYVSNKGVYVYGMDNKLFHIREKDYSKKWTYTKLIYSNNNVKNVFIGKSPITKMTKFSRGHGRGFTGNSILVHEKGNKYVYIGKHNVERVTINNDKIKEYISPVGNSDVPYTVAIGEKNVYFMLDMKYVPISKFDTFTRAVKNDAYSYFYGHHIDENNNDKKLKPLECYAKRMKSKVIHDAF
jgi:hypothetical protein